MSKMLPAVLAMWLVFPLRSSADSSFVPNVKPTYNVARLNGSIVIDGMLDDSGWQGLNRATNFAEQFPNNGDKAPVETEVMLTYDDDNLYIAFICHDPDPTSIRSSWSDRDRIWSDDYMGMIFDTYGEGAWSYEIFCNPKGLQGDGRQVTSAGEDIGFDLIFESRGIVTDSCYQIEIALPFASIRFPDKPVQEWRATFWRTRPRESRSTSSWAYVDDNSNCMTCEFGTITGIENIKPGKNFELLPSVIGFQSAELRDENNIDSGLENQDTDGEASLGIRYSITSSLTAEATVNPDFSQVESDATQIDVNEAFALFYPEKRPFFQEGGDLFESRVNVVYTRSINDPQFAAKLIRREGSSNFAYMGAVDQNSPIIVPLEERSGFVDAGKSYSNIVRYKHTLGGSSSLGAIFSDRRFESGGSNSVYGIDGNIRFKEKYRIEAQVVGSHSGEPDDTLLTADIDQTFFDDGKYTVAYDGESFSGHSFSASIERHSRNWGFDLDLRDTSPGFRADNGFITRNDHREAELWSGYDFYPENRLFDNIETGFVYGRVWNSRGEFKDHWLVTYLGAMLKAQTSANLSHIYTQEIFRGVDLPEMNRLELNISSNFSEPVQAGFNYYTGEFIARNEDPPVVGDGLNFAIWVDIKATSRLKIEQVYRFSSLKRQDNDVELFKGYIYRTRINYQFNREIFLRLVLQYNDFDENFDIDPLLSYKLNPFTIFYIGSTVDYTDINDSGEMTLTSRQFFAKFQYLFRM
ncbi:MAG: DUF5916 domain-containing protein [candidate division Zixibacteria bacterium]